MNYPKTKFFSYQVVSMMDTSFETSNRNITKGEREKLNKCNQCDFTSVQADNLRTHLKSHLRKAYKCNKCDFASVRADNLRRHLKKHTNATNATLHL